MYKNLKIWQLLLKSCDLCDNIYSKFLTNGFSRKKGKGTCSKLNMIIERYPTGCQQKHQSFFRFMLQASTKGY